MMPLDDFFDDGKADAGTILALMLCPVEALEQLGKLFGSHSAAIVLNNAEECGFRPLQLHPDHSIVRGMLTGIFKQVQKCFPQPSLITANMGRTFKS